MVREVRGTVGVLAFFGLLGSTIAIIAGGYLVYRGSMGSTEITILGQHISTSNAGVAFVFLGIVCLILVIRRAFDTLNKAIAYRD
jgi:hypothetical protein